MNMKEWFLHIFVAVMAAIIAYVSWGIGWNRGHEDGFSVGVIGCYLNPSNCRKFAEPRIEEQRRRAEEQAQKAAR